MYKAPLAEEKLNVCPLKKSVAHLDSLKNSMDFVVEENTPVYAAEDGTVVWIKDNSKIGGNDKKYWNKGNRIVIKHDNEEYTAYEHLGYKKVEVSKGQRVRKGELLGYTGNTGYLGPIGPHLHFEVFINPSEDESEGETIPIKFENFDISELDIE